MKIDRLFVYGTLMRGGRLHHELDAIRAEFRGKGSIRAALYAIKGEWYPGAIPDDSSVTWGEVYLLPNLESALVHLDEVEGVAAGDGSFQRRAVEVRFGSKRFAAWTYFYTAPLQRSRRIRSGRFKVSGRN